MINQIQFNHTGNPHKSDTYKSDFLLYEMALLVPSLILQFYNLHITLILPISDRKSWSQFIRLKQGYLYYEIHNMFFRKIFFFSLIPNVKCPPWRRQRTLTGWSNLCVTVCECSHSKSHSINHKQNYSVSLSDVSCVEIRFWQTSSPWQEHNSTQAKRFFLQEHESVPQRFLLLQVQSKSCITSEADNPS